MQSNELLKEILDRVVRIESMLVGPAPGFDPKVFSDPRDWVGESYKDKSFSECPAAYLELLATAYDRFAEKSEKEGVTLKNGKPKADWDRKLANTALAWAKHAAVATKKEVSRDSELPF